VFFGPKTKTRYIILRPEKEVPKMIDIKALEVFPSV